MPHAINIARSAMTPEMKGALRSYIIKQRQKKKEEEEQDEALRNERKQLEEKKLRDQHSLEEVNKQITQLEKKLTEFKQEKHDLFAQLKKVLHQEDEQRKRLQQIQQQHAKDASEVLAKVGPAVAPLPLLGTGPSLEEQAGQQQAHSRLAPGPPSGQVFQQAASSGQPQYVPSQTATVAGTVPAVTTMKRQRSPSPPASAVVKEPAPYPAYFSSPKRMAVPYQRSPYQGSFGHPLHSPPCLSPRMPQPAAPVAPAVLPGGPASVPPGHYPPYVSPAMAALPGAQPFNAGASVGMMSQVRPPYRPLHDVRSPHAAMEPTVSGQTSAQPRPHVSPVGIPVIPPHKRMGSITSGYPVHKPAPAPSPSLQRTYFNPRGAILQHPGHRFM